MDDATQSRLLQAILAPVLQPQAQLGLTQQEAATSGQSQQTGAAEQQNLQAQNPAIKAQATTSQVQATQNLAGLTAGKAIQQGMDLQSALKKYVPLGANADDIFQKYLSTGKFPTESLTQLKNLGVSDKALGAVGDLSSFADRQNMRNAIEELRGLQDTFNNTSTLAKLPFGNQFGSGKVYEGQRQIVGQHLSSLVQGAPHAAGSSEDLMSSIPDSGDISQLQRGEAKQQFTKAEQTLLQSKGYKYSDLGLTPPSNLQPQQKQSTGSHLLNGILNQATNGGQGGDVRQSAIDVLQGNPGKALTDYLGTNPKAITKNVANAGVGGFNNAMLTAVGGEAGLGILGKIVGKGGVSAIDNLPGSLRRFISPSSAINKAGNIRNQIVSDAQQAGKTISGNDVLAGIKDWATKGKMGNLGQGDAIDKAVSDATAIFKGKQLNPQDVMDAYKEADSGFTRTGIAKTPIQANIDRGLRDVLANELDKVAPGWQKATTNMAKSYQAAKSPVRQGAKNALKYGIPLATGQATGDILTRVLGL